MSPPQDFSDAELANAYIVANGMTDDKSCSWANEEMMVMPHEDPERAWHIILAIIERDPPIWVLSILGAGPMEDLLRAHGVDFIDRIEQEAAQNVRFLRDVLACVYPIA